MGIRRGKANSPLNIYKSAKPLTIDDFKGLTPTEEMEVSWLLKRRKQLWEDLNDCRQHVELRPLHVDLQNWPPSKEVAALQVRLFTAEDVLKTEERRGSKDTNFRRSVGFAPQINFMQEDKAKDAPTDTENDKEQDGMSP